MKYWLLLLLLVLLTVYCSENFTTYQSSSKIISSFTIEEHALNGIIDQAAKTIIVKVTPDINITELVPTIEYSEYASINLAAGMPVNFTNPVTVTVTAEDGSQNVYTITFIVGNYILNSCLHIVHMQDYFINGTGIRNSEETIEAIQVVLNAARDGSIPVVYAKSMPAYNRDIITELAPRSTEIVVETSSNALTLQTIDNLNVQNIVVVGIYTNLCVRDICTQLRGRGYNVILVQDATSVANGTDVELIQTTCDELEENGTVTIISSDEVLF